jgi:tetratricopeptide (TPR) repeat protein/cellulose biosynthesis protein BcsQ
MIYTFYSYKGGVGRTMALANVAELFYRSGLKVLMVDWDLEAPGLERFFPLDLDEVLDKPGVMDMLLGYKAQMAQGLNVAEDEKDLPFEKPSKFMINIYPEDRSDGKLWLLPSGRRSKEHFADYAYAVRTFDWQDFYENWEGELYFEWLRQQFEQMADVVLIDSRTGVTEMGGVCVYQFADVVVLFCSANQQSLDGTQKMLIDFKQSKVQELRGRPLETVVVPARIEDAESAFLDEFQREFLDRFAKYTPSALGAGSDQFWRLAVPYVPRYAYKEAVAVREEGKASAKEMVEAVTLLAFAISRLAPQDSSIRLAVPETQVEVGGRTVVGSDVGGFTVVGDSVSIHYSAPQETRQVYEPPPPPDSDTLPEPGPLPPGSRIPFGPNANFTGREEALKALARALLHGDGATLITQAVLGMGGIGKTQLAVEFAHRYGRFFHGVHWINAAQPEGIAGEIATCGQKMAAAREAPFPQKMPDQLAWTLATWQQGKRRLLILDNLEDISAAREWLGQLCGGPLRILLTARRADWPADLGLSPHSLDTFTPEESHAFLQRYLPEDEVQALDNLAERLGHLPLALEMAGRYLKRRRRKRVVDYLEELDQPLHHHSMRNWREELGNPTGHDLDMMATFALSWEEISDETAQRLFLIAGYCAPGEPIPYKLLERAADLEQDVCDETLDRLISLGLLDLKASNVGPTIHPLLSEYARASDMTLGKDLLSDLSSAMMAATGEALDTGFPERFQLLRPHARAVAKWAEEKGIEQAGMLWSNLGSHLYIVADYAGARASLRRALALWREAYGEEHPLVATALNNLGNVQQTLGDLEGARGSYEQALRIDEAAYDPDHPNVAQAINNLGSIQQDLGDLEGARGSYERALRIDEAAYGPDHPNVARDVNNLGSVQQALGDLEGARASFEQALRIDEAAYGPDHPNVARDVNNLGSVQQALGDLEGARASFEQALRIDEAAYGPDHPNVARDINNLGSIQQDLGDLEGARGSYERALRIFEQVLGLEHPNVATLVNNLGLVQQDLGDLEGARGSYERALRIDEAAYGPDHPNVARDINNLGLVQQDLGDLEGARASFERALRIDEAAFDPHHPEVATALNNLGMVQQDLGDLEGARASFVRALQIFERVFPSDHPHVEIVRGNLEESSSTRINEGARTPL